MATRAIGTAIRGEGEHVSSSTNRRRFAVGEAIVVNLKKRIFGCYIVCKEVF